MNISQITLELCKLGSKFLVLLENGELAFSSSLFETVQLPLKCVVCSSADVRGFITKSSHTMTMRNVEDFVMSEIEKCRRL